MICCRCWRQGRHLGSLLLSCFGIESEGETSSLSSSREPHALANWARSNSFGQRNGKVAEPQSRLTALFILCRLLSELWGGHGRAITFPATQQKILSSICRPCRPRPRVAIGCQLSYVRLPDLCDRGGKSIKMKTE